MVVCDPSWRDVFERAMEGRSMTIKCVSRLLLTLPRAARRPADTAWACCMIACACRLLLTLPQAARLSRHCMGMLHGCMCAGWAVGMNLPSRGNSIPTAHPKQEGGTFIFWMGGSPTAHGHGRSGCAPCSCPHACPHACPVTFYRPMFEACSRP